MDCRIRFGIRVLFPYYKANGLRVQGKALATHLAKSLGRFREHITVGKTTPSTTAAVSPAPMRP